MPQTALQCTGESTVEDTRSDSSVYSSRYSSVYSGDQDIRLYGGDQDSRLYSGDQEIKLETQGRDVKLDSSFQNRGFFDIQEERNNQSPGTQVKYYTLSLVLICGFSSSSDLFLHNGKMFSIKNFSSQNIFHIIDLIKEGQLKSRNQSL